MRIPKSARPHRRLRVPFITGLIVFIALAALAFQQTASASLLLRELRAAFKRNTATQSGARTLISTIVGGGLSANAPARTAPMVEPAGVALDPQGRGFYVQDDIGGTSLLRFVNTTSGAVTIAGVTIAAGGAGLIAGGGGETEAADAREADLTIVTGLAVDSTGNAVYLATPLAGAIRAINVGAQEFRVFNQSVQPGAIKNIFPINRPDFRALAVNAAREIFYIGNSPVNGARVVFKLDSNANSGNGLEAIYAGGGTPLNANGDGQLATLAKLTQPMALGFDAQGNLLIAEGGDNRNNPGAVRKVDAGGLISSLIGGLEFPTGITLGPGGNVYVALGNAQQIVRITPGGSKTVVAGNAQKVACDMLTTPVCGDGGAALNAYLNLPGSTQLKTLSFAANASGIFLPDLTYRRVRFINTTGGAANVAGTTIGPAQINTIAGSGAEAPYDNGPALLTEMAAPTGVAADGLGNLFIADTTPDPVSRLRYVNRTSLPVTLFPNTPWAITVEPGHIATLNHKAGEPVSDDRITTAIFASPQGLARTPLGIYIVDSQYGALVRPPGSLNGRRSGHVRFLNTSGSDVTLFPQGGSARVVVPPGMVKDVAGRNDQPPAGSIGENGPANQAVLFPSDVAVDAQGNLYIADQGNNRIRKIAVATGIVTSVQAPQPDQTLGPLVTAGAAGIAFGPDGRLHIADTKADRILRQDAPNGTTFTIIANNTKGISRPRDLTVDASGQVFVVNANSHQILRVAAPSNALGTVSVTAGVAGQRGFGGDGGPGNRARLDLPTPGTATNDLQVTANIIQLASGDLVFTDTNNNRIRLLVQLPNQAPALAAIADRTMDEGATATIDLAATDGNQDPIAFSARNLPGFAALADNGNGTARLQLAPGFSDAGSYSIEVSASDGEAADSKTVSLTVKDVNRAPVVTAVAIPSPFEAASAGGRSVDLSGSASDPDGDAIAYKWFDGGTQIAASANAQVPLAIGTHSISLSAVDSKGATASSQPQAVVIRDTTPPVIAGVPANVTVQAGDAGAAVTYAMPTAADAVDGAVAVTADKASGSLFPVGDTSVKFTAADSRGNAAMAAFLVTVTPKPGGNGGGGGGGGGGGNTTTPASYTIASFAGTSNYGNEGNHGPATEATLKQINALRRDAAGVMLVDQQSRVVRRVDLQGVIRPLAGNGANGNAGDNGLATYATFGSPGGAAVDAQGNLYVSDITNHRVRRVAPDGKIAHFAGSAAAQSGSQGDNGAATAAKLNRPSALAVYADTLFITDSGNHRIRAINLATNIITNHAGNGGAGYGVDGVVATTTSLNSPSGIAFDAAGNLFIADRNNHRVRRVDAAGKIIISVAGTDAPGFSGDNGPANVASLNNPTDVATDAAGNVYVTDHFNHRIRRIRANGTIETIAGSGAAGNGGDGGPALQAQLNLPLSLEVGLDGSIYVGDNGNLRVRKLTPAAAPNPTPTPTPSANRNPVITSNVGNQSLTRGQTLDLPLAASDPDNDSVSFTLMNAPAFASIANANPQQRTATLHLALAQAGVFANLRIKADDGKGGTTLSGAFSITVLEPSTNPCVASVPADHWRGEYFSNRFLSGAPAMVRDDGQGSINMEWGFGGPSTECGVGVDNFSVRWTRELPLLGGRYRFTTFSDDGLRLYVDGELILDRWVDRGEMRDDVEVNLTGGKHAFKFEYFENSGMASARLFWNALNYAPIVAEIPAQSVRRGQTLEVEITAADPDNDPVALSLENAPPFITLVNANPALRRASLRIAPPAGDGDQRFDLRIKADDSRGGVGFSNTFAVTITNGAPPPPQNRAPVAVTNALAVTVAAPDTSGAVVHLDASASSDPDGDALTYSWADQGAVISTAKIADVKLPVGSHSIALTVNDGRGGTNTAAAQSLTITAPPPPPPPPPVGDELTINSISPSSGKRGTTVNVVVNGSGFLPGATVSLSGGGLSANTTFLDDNRLNVRMTITSAAFTTLRTLTVVNPGGAAVTKLNAFNVAP